MHGVRGHQQQLRTRTLKFCGACRQQSPSGFPVTAFLQAHDFLKIYTVHHDVGAVVASEAAVDLTVNDPIVQGGALRAHAADNA